MAYTKTPMQDTEKNTRVPLFYQWENRFTESGTYNALNTKDAGNTNVVFEAISSPTGESYFRAMKRDGTYLWALPSPPTGTIVGMATFGNNIVVVTSTEIRVYSESGVLVSVNAQVWGVNVGFTEFLYEDGTVGLVISDSNTFGVLNPGFVWTVCTDPDRPTNQLPYPVFLDGYLFLASNSQIFNSVNNDPLSWVASDFIYAEAYPDTINALGRVGDYVVAFGEYSTQWFYDAANPTGTPLAPVTGATKLIGFSSGLCAVKDEIYFIGHGKGTSLGLYVVSGLSVKQVDAGTISRYVARTNATARGVLLVMNGHTMYTISVDTSTYMFDLESKIWSNLLFGTSQEEQSIAGAVVFVNNTSPRRYSTFFALNDTINGRVYSFRNTLYQDNGVDFPVQFTTRSINFGTSRIKFGGRLLIVSDQTPSQSFMTVSWSDDDYQTFSTPRSIDLSKQYRQMYQLGSFRQRAFRVYYSDNFPMRWEGIELDYNQGQA